jgi:capsular polysaccharide transport system permease protein
MGGGPPASAGDRGTGCNAGAHLPHSMQVASFALSGYVPFLLFRNIVLRAGPTIESNRTLLYHRFISLMDLHVSRAMLEFVSVIATYLLLLGLFAAFGMASLPDRPLESLVGFTLLTWMSTGLGMILSAAVEKADVIERFIHPITYIALPMSGAFSLMEWLPKPVQEALWWFPLSHAFEVIREGQFGDFESKFANIPYALTCCVVLTFFGLLALRAVRPYVHAS